MLPTPFFCLHTIDEGGDMYLLQLWLTSTLRVRESALTLDGKLKRRVTKLVGEIRVCASLKQSLHHMDSGEGTTESAQNTPICRGDLMFQSRATT